MKPITKTTLRIYRDHMRPYGKYAALVAVGLFLSVAGDIIAPLFYKRFFDLIAGTAGVSASAYTLLKIVWYVLLVHLGAWLASRLVFFAINRIELRVMTDLKNTCFAYLHAHSYGFFASRFSGALVQKQSRFANAFETIFDQLAWNLYPLALRILFIVIVLMYTNLLLGTLMVAWIAIFLAANYAFTVYKLRYDVEAAEMDTLTTAHIADTVTNNVNIKLFGSLADERAKFKMITEKQFKARRTAWDLGMYVDSFQALLTILLEFLIFYFAVGFWEQGRLTVGDFVLIQAYLVAILYQMWSFGKVVRGLYRGLADAEEMALILATPHDIRDRPGAKPLRTPKGLIEFRGVSFRYGAGGAALDHFDFRIAPGERIGVVGPSGAGKSTLVSLLFRFYDVTKGKILIDNQNIAGVTQDSLRAAIALVPQDPILFHRSLLENIRYGRRDAADDEVRSAAQLAHCDEFIEKQPEGYATLVGERGIKLSGGQRQRIAIARAILKGAPILVLDEATSSLDSYSEMMIQDALANLMEGKTVMVIAHRLSTIMKMDRIIVMERGKIIEAGTHASLLSRHGSLYRKLWQLQAGGFLAA